MTKENFINKWAFKYNVNYTTNPYFIDDLEAVIAHEVAKVQPEKTNKIEITPYALIELNRAFCVLKDDESSKLHNFFGNDAINEIKQVYEAYFRGKERQIKPEEANPQTELKFKIGDRLINFNKGGSYGNVCKLLANCPFELYDINTKTYFITNSLSGYELYTEPEQPKHNVLNEKFSEVHHKIVDGLGTILSSFGANSGIMSIVMSWGDTQDSVSTLQMLNDYIEKYIDKQPTEQTSNQVKLDNSFDKERFEAMFRAVVASGEKLDFEYCKRETTYFIQQLDAYYATKNN